jgi:hypothetical protein
MRMQLAQQADRTFKALFAPATRERPLPAATPYPQRAGAARSKV